MFKKWDPERVGPSSAGSNPMYIKSYNEKIINQKGDFLYYGESLAYSLLPLGTPALVDARLGMSKNSDRRMLSIIKINTQSINNFKGVNLKM